MYLKINFFKLIVINLIILTGILYCIYNGVLNNLMSNLHRKLPGYKGKNLGEFGVPFAIQYEEVDYDDQKKIEEGMNKHHFNKFMSDQISVKRQLPDFRDEWCKMPGRFEKDLPQTSVIITSHNEAWSTLFRTVNSVIDRSPPELIKEIIVVDDYSDIDSVEDLLLFNKLRAMPGVSLIQTSKREGLIRARLIGVKASKAPIITFLDSHCECTTGWLEPLLDRIVKTADIVVSPIIDTIDYYDFSYIYQKNVSFVGGFNWLLEYTRIPIAEREKAKKRHHAEPVQTPRIAGGIFSIDKRYFESLEMNDDGFEIWGGDNLELSFKVWMCGGTIEIVPCSHVGHVFRDSSPLDDDDDDGHTHDKNSARLAEVWLDDYAKYFYMHIGVKNISDFEDVSSRKALRKSLNCKSFEWYLKNVFPELILPHNCPAFGQIANQELNLCLTNIKDKYVDLFFCNHYGHQISLYTKSCEIRFNDNCLTYNGSNHMFEILRCHNKKGNQLWIYDNNTTLRHHESGLCLGIWRITRSLVMATCNVSNSMFQWSLENYKPELIDKSVTLLEKYVRPRS